MCLPQHPFMYDTGDILVDCFLELLFKYPELQESLKKAAHPEEQR